MLSVPPTNGPDGILQLHASTVVISGKAVCIAGPSGVGKSALALVLMAHGAGLIADDITWITRENGALVASCPPAIKGRIEARNVGILNATAAPPAPVALIVDLGAPETERLPPQRTTPLLGVDVAVLHNPSSTHFFAAILQYINHGRAE